MSISNLGRHLLITKNRTCAILPRTLRVAQLPQILPIFLGDTSPCAQPFTLHIPLYLQTNASIEDQHRLCARLIEGNGWREAKTYADRAISGSSHLRPDFQRLLENAHNNIFDVVVAEGLDRISRDQEHIAGFFKQKQFLNIPIFTAAEGEISELHIGLKGTMSSLFIRDLALKTRRGLEGRVRKGKSAGGVTYGYDVVRSLQADGEMTTGGRVINEEQAEIVRSIFRDYANGISPRTIAAALNGEGIAGLRTAGWGASTIYGNHKRGTGILNNELYIGRLVWNRQRFIKAPNTGKRQTRLNPPEDWVIEEVPHLQIVPQDLWDAVKARQEATRNAAISDGVRKLGRTKWANHLFSGVLTCGECDDWVNSVGKANYGCANTPQLGNLLQPPHDQTHRFVRPRSVRSQRPVAALGFDC